MLEKGHHSGDVKSKMNNKMAFVYVYEDFVMTLHTILYLLRDIMEP